MALKGVVFAEFLAMVETEYGLETLDHIIEKSKLPSNGTYTSFDTYNFSEMQILVKNLSELAHIPVNKLLYDFGKFLFNSLKSIHPDVITIYKDPISLVNCIERHISQYVKNIYPRTKLSYFKILQRNEKSVTLVYESSRGLYKLAQGLIEQAFIEFGEKPIVSYKLLKKDGTQVKFEIAKMNNKEVQVLNQNIERHKTVRKQTEIILEKKLAEMHESNLRLKKANKQLQEQLSQKTSELEGIFTNMIDLCIVFDLQGNIIKMNDASVDALGYNCKTEKVNLLDIVLEEDKAYVKKLFSQLKTTGHIWNLRTKVITKRNLKKSIRLNASTIYDMHKKPIAVQAVIQSFAPKEEVKYLLPEKRKQLDIIVENSPLGIILTDKGQIVKANKAFQDLLGYNMNELGLLKTQEISLAEDIDSFALLMQKLDSGEIEQFSIVNHYIKKNGDVILGRSTASAVKNLNGEIIYLVAIVEDITQQRKIEEKIASSESRLSNLISNLHMGVLLEDHNGKVTLTNQIFCDMLGSNLKPKDFIGKKYEGLLKAYAGVFRHPKEFVQSTISVLEAKEIVLHQPVELKNGKVYERDFVPIYAPKGYSGHMWIYNDISIEANYKRNLEVQKEKYSSVIASMNLGLIEVDLEDNVLLVNDNFCQMSGYSQNELLGKKAIEILNIKNRELVENRNGSDHISGSYQVEVKNKDGEWRYWLISGAPRYDESGKVIGSIGIHLDITSQKQLELQKEQLLEQLEEQNTSLQEYAHIVSHDLKSPLRSLSALVSWLDEDYRDKLDENAVNNIQMMQDKIEGMDKLINGILQYSRIKSDRLQNTLVDVNEVVAEISEIIYLPQNVKVNIPEPLPKIMADRTKIHQLFQNIMSNAAENIDKPDGIIEIGYSENDTHWCFLVSDNGVGIPEEYYEKIFQVFQSIGNDKRSTGIGLSIVKKIVDLYQGKIHLDSEVGKGTNFCFTIKKNLQ